MRCRYFITVFFCFFSFSAFCHQSLSQEGGSDEEEFNLKSNDQRNRLFLNQLESATNFQKLKPVNIFTVTTTKQSSKSYTIEQLLDKKIGDWQL